MKKTQKFKELMERDEVLVLPGAHDALTAKIIEKQGFEALYVTGYGFVASSLGLPDAGLVTMTEMVRNARHIASAVDIPVFHDANTGYGNAINVIRTVKEFEKTGIAGIHLEDQASPKKCGYMAGLKLVSIEEMEGKIKAATEARDDPDFVIAARTDGRVIGLDEAIKRAKAYEKAGADIVWAERLQATEEMKMVIKSINTPHLLMAMPGVITPALSVSECKEIGYDIIVFWGVSLFTTTRAVMDAIEQLKRSGSVASIKEKMIEYNEFQEFIGVQDIYALENKYLPKEE